MSEYEQPKWGIALSKAIPIPQRFIMAFMGLLAIMNAYTMRNCLSVTLTQLVKLRNYTEADLESENVCPKEEEVHHAQTKHGNYDWDQELQGIILGAFYIGYIISHLPGGILADICGGKWVLSLGIFSTALFTLATPYCIKFGGAYALIAMRALMGLGEGTTFPALSTLLSRWVPPSERGKLGSLVLSGGILGQVLGQTIAGVILSHFEWPVVFYFFGCAGVLWFLFFTILCFSDPFSHPYIKPSEKELLLAEMGRLKQHTITIIPWKSILTSRPVIVLIICQIGHDWGFFVMAIDLPKYMNDVLQFNVKNNGIYSSFPFISMWISSILMGIIGDALIKKNVVSITNVRKTMTAIAAVGPAVFMVLAGYAGCDKFIVVVYFTISLFLMGPYYCGMKLTPLDISPTFAGILMSLCNGIGSITGYIAPWLVGVMTPNTTMQEWRMVFWLALVMLISTAIAYVIWASGEVQEWDQDKTQEKA